MLDARAGWASENLLLKSHCTWAAPQDKCHPQTIAVTASRADGLGLKVEVGDESSFEFGKDVCGVLLQYPATDGSLHDYKARPVAVLDEAGARRGLQSRLYLSWNAGAVGAAVVCVAPGGVFTSSALLVGGSAGREGTCGQGRDGWGGV